jgi:hypothetical protein
MVVERTNEGILIKGNGPINMKVVQRLIDYYQVTEITARAKGTEQEAAALADEVDKKWWAENKHRFLK